MRTSDIVTSAIGNAFRSKLRTSLTVLALVIGAFTLSLTSGLGAGITNYIDDTVASVGVDGVMTVTRAAETTATDGPQEYDPDAVASAGVGPGPDRGTVTALTSADLTTLSATDGVLDVQPARTVSVDYVQHDGGTPYQVTVGAFLPGMSLTLDAGSQLDDSSDELQLALPVAYLEPLGLGTSDEAVGQSVTLAVTDADGTQSSVDATVVGVMADGLVSAGSAVPNTALLDRLAEVQDTGRTAEEVDRYAQAYVWFDPAASDEDVTALQSRLQDAGYDSTTLQDQLGSFTSVIDTITLVLNGFAVIALLAAGIGIVNTLLMSVQERTREIGLMKAVGMGSGRVFSLFTLEAVTIGLLGSVLGVLGAFGVGSVATALLSDSLLADLPGLSLFAFEPGSVAIVVLGVMALAFLAGTLPAARAARQDPITSLRYE